MHWIAKPGASVTALRRTTERVERELLGIPGVRNAGAHLGRAEVADEVVGPNFGEVWVSVDPSVDHAETVRRIEAHPGPVPGHLPRRADLPARAGRRGPDRVARIARGPGVRGGPRRARGPGAGDCRDAARDPGDPRRVGRDADLGPPDRGAAAARGGGGVRPDGGRHPGAGDDPGAGQPGRGGHRRSRPGAGGGMGDRGGPRGRAGAATAAAAGTRRSRGPALATWPTSRWWRRPTRSDTRRGRAGSTSLAGCRAARWGRWRPMWRRRWPRCRFLPVTTPRSWASTRLGRTPPGSCSEAGRCRSWGSCWCSMPTSDRCG